MDSDDFNKEFNNKMFVKGNEKIYIIETIDNKTKNTYGYAEQPFPSIKWRFDNINKYSYDFFKTNIKPFLIKEIPLLYKLKNNDFINTLTIELDNIWKSLNNNSSFSITFFPGKITYNGYLLELMKIPEPTITDDEFIQKIIDYYKTNPIIDIPKEKESKYTSDNMNMVNPDAGFLPLWLRR
jgi:hypothetical protein